MLKNLLIVGLLIVAAPIQAEVMTVEVPYNGGVNHDVVLPVVPDAINSVQVQIVGNSLPWLYHCSWADIGGVYEWDEYGNNRIDLTVVAEGGVVPYIIELSPPNGDFDLSRDWGSDWLLLEDGACTLQVWSFVLLDDENGACGTVLEQGHIDVETLILTIEYEGPVAAEMQSWGLIKALYR